MAKTRPNNAVTIGVLYQRSEDPVDVVHATGAGHGRVRGYDVKGETFDASDEEVLSWTQLATNDFPNSPDPQLPYVYDLYWDIKRVSELGDISASERDTVETFLVRDFGVEKPFSNLAALTKAVRLKNDIDNEYIQAPPGAGASDKNPAP